MLSVVSNLIAHLVELANLLPGEIVLRVLEKAQSLGDIEGCSKSVLLEDLGDVGEVGLVAVVEGQDHEIVRDWEQLTGRLQFFTRLAAVFAEEVGGFFLFFFFGPI